MTQRLWADKSGLRQRKILYHFAIFAIVSEILIFKDCRMSSYLPAPIVIIAKIVQ